MFTAFLYQFLIDFLSHQRTFTYSAFLRDLVRSRDIRDFKRLGEFWKNELQKLIINDKGSATYYFFILKHALLYYFHRRSPDRFHQIVDMARHKMESSNLTAISEVPFTSWKSYLDLIDIAFRRVMRHATIEEYEAHLDQLDWDSLDSSFIPEISSLIGATYLSEEPGSQQDKSRLWFFKALHETSFTYNISNHLFMAAYYLDNKRENHAAQVEGILEALKKGKSTMKNAAAEDVVQLAIEDLEASFFTYKLVQAKGNIEIFQPLKENLRHHSIAAKKAELHDIPAFTIAHRASILAKACDFVANNSEQELDKERFIEKMTQEIELAVSISKELNDNLQSTYYRLLAAQFQIHLKQQLTEKELKEVVQYYRKQNNYPLFIKASHAYAVMLTEGKQPDKALDIILDIFKLGNKNIDEGGFYLLYAGFRLANDVFLVEIEKPGVSWVVSTLDIFFVEIRSIIDKITTLIDLAGKELLEDFRREYLRFDPVANFNIKVYFRYQLYGLKMVHLGNVLKEDAVSITLSKGIIEKLENDNNPLHFILGEWDDFKDIPNDVRNKTLNRCINISKGDLPLAAEHLDFSYRNLRSYITFKEVNRLGFFLDLQKTDNKQLELGIRYIFYDLYKKGTIFEVVFDMPIFLVKYAKTGFYSQDLESELNIKGTTAKKYIKIMIEIGLIRQDKTTGRKHYYRLIRENVMKRLGREQNMLIE